MKARHAFTLIELLVVIAIIAILAGILFPVFVRAKSAAHHTDNLSKIKQLGLSSHIYTADYDDHFISLQWATVVGAADAVEYFQVLGPYLKNYEVLYDYYRTNTCSSTDYPGLPVGNRRCPGFGPVVGLLDRYNIPGNTTQDTAMFDRAFRGAGFFVLPGKSMTAFPDPANMAMFNTTQDGLSIQGCIFDHQNYTLPEGGRSPSSKTRNDGRWICLRADSSAKTTFWAAYTAPGVPHLAMPKARREAEQFCYAPEADAGLGETCQMVLDNLFASRVLIP